MSSEGEPNAKDVAESLRRKAYRPCSSYNDTQAYLIESLIRLCGCVVLVPILPLTLDLRLWHGIVPYSSTGLRFHCEPNLLNVMTRIHPRIIVVLRYQQH